MSEHQSKFRADIDIVRRSFKIHIPFGEALQAMRLYNGDIVSAAMHISDERSSKQTTQSFNGSWRKPKSPI